MKKTKSFITKCMNCNYKSFRISAQEEEEMRCYKCGSKLEILAREK